MNEFLRKLLAESFPKPPKPGKLKKGYARVVNAKTGAKLVVKIPGEKALLGDMTRGLSPCVGPCKCQTDLDGGCPEGWPSRAHAFAT